MYDVQAHKLHHGDGSDGSNGFDMHMANLKIDELTEKLVLAHNATATALIQQRAELVQEHDAAMARSTATCKDLVRWMVTLDILLTSRPA